MLRKMTNFERFTKKLLPFELPPSDDCATGELKDVFSTVKKQNNNKYLFLLL